METTPQATQDADAQRILDNLNGVLPKGDPSEDVDLPSDSYPQAVDEDEPTGDKLFANKYKTVEDLKKGIKSIGSTLPDYIIEGMNDAALEKHYSELQSEFSKSGRKYEDAPKEDSADEKKPSDKPKAVSSELWAELGETFNTSGRITTEQYDKLEALGIPSEIVDNYLDGLQAKTQATAREIITIAGGDENFKVMKEWAENNIDATYINSIGNMPHGQMLEAIKGIKAQYDLENGSPRRLAGETSTTSVGAYRSKEEYLADVRDKRYGKDALFMGKVQAKLARSKNLV